MLQAYNLQSYQKTLRHSCFPANISYHEIFKNTFIGKHPWSAASTSPKKYAILEKVQVLQITLAKKCNFI